MNCVVFGIFYCFDLNHLVREFYLFIYVFIMAVFGDG